MKNIYFTCGPSQLYPTVKKHIKEALEKEILSLSHRSQIFQQIYKETALNLKKLLNIPSDYHLFFLSSSLESMERILENCLIKYSFHFINGSFSEKFYQMAVDLGKNPKKFKVFDGEGIDFNTVNIPKGTELISITQNETSTGVAFKPEEIEKLKEKYPDKLLAVDIVSSVPYPKLDFRKIDLAFFSVQKGFGLPAGLSVLIVSPKAIEKAKFMKEKGYKIGSFHNFVSLEEKAKINQTPETPNILNIFLLGKIAQDMLSDGIEKIRKDTDLKAKLIYSYFDNHPLFKPAVKERRWRSPTTIVINTFGKSKIILERLKREGFILSSGYGENKHNKIRIANFPSHKISDVKKLLFVFDKFRI